MEKHWTTNMKQDLDKMREWIKITRKGRPSASIYRTFLYCVRSQYRGRLHMKVWNKDYPLMLQMYDPAKGVVAANPKFGKVEFNSLDDQARFIANMVQYIKACRERAEAHLKAGNTWEWLYEWAGVETNFDKPDDIGTVDAVNIIP